MNKQFLAATLAAALMVPMASHAVDATLYGSIRAGLASGDADLPSGQRDPDGASGGLDLGATGVDGNLNNQGLYSRIGVRGSAELSNGMTAGLHLERGVGNTLSVRHTNVWLEGGFGKLTFGQQGNPYRKARNWDQSWFLGGQFGFNDGGSRIEGINYSMSNGPFSLSVMATAKDNDPSDTAGTITMTGATNTDTTYSSAAKVEYDDSVDSWVIAAGYDFGIAALNVAHRTDNTDVEVAPITASATGGTITPANMTTAMNASEAAVDALRSSDNTAIGLNGSIGALGWYLSYQTSADNANNFENDVDSVGGFLSFKPSDSDTLYVYHVSHSADRETRDANGVTLGESPTETILGYSHSFGEGVSFHAEYLTIDNDLPAGADGSDLNTLVLAMKVDF